MIRFKFDYANSKSGIQEAHTILRFVFIKRQVTSTICLSGNAGRSAVASLVLTRTLAHETCSFERRLCSHQCSGCWASSKVAMTGKAKRRSTTKDRRRLAQRPSSYSHSSTHSGVPACERDVTGDRRGKQGGNHRTILASLVACRVSRGQAGRGGVPNDSAAVLHIIIWRYLP